MNINAVNIEMASHVDVINAFLDSRNDGFHIEYRDIPKSGGYMPAYVIRTQTSMASPVIYGDTIGKIGTLPELADYLEDVYRNSSLDIDETVLSGSYVLQHVMPHVASAEKAAYYRKEGYTTIDFLDMVITFAIEIEGDRFYLLRDETMIHAGIRIDQVADAAIKHLESRYSIHKMADIVPYPDDEGGVPLFIVSTDFDGASYGASVLISEKIMSAAAEQLNDDLVVFPSSVHEILIVPREFAGALCDCSSLVRDVNETCVRPEDQLTNHAYLWLRNEKRLTVID